MKYFVIGAVVKDEKQRIDSTTLSRNIHDDVRDDETRARKHPPTGRDGSKYRTKPSLPIRTWIAPFISDGASRQTCEHSFLQGSAVSGTQAPHEPGPVLRVSAPKLCCRIKDGDSSRARYGSMP